jgi:hypothetical protein
MFVEFHFAEYYGCCFGFGVVFKSRRIKVLLLS